MVNKERKSKNIVSYKGKKSRLKTALVLAGGGSKGAYEIGALKVILDKIIPDVVIGTSVGSINGAFMALGIPIKEVEKYWLELHKSVFFTFNPEFFYMFPYSESIYKNDKWHAWLKKKLGNKQFKDCKTSLLINATKLSDGSGVYIKSGSLVDAVMASSAIPPIFPPYKIKGTRYIDGGISDYIGTSASEDLKCKQTIIVSLGYRGRMKNHEKNFFEYVTNSINLLVRQTLRNGINRCTGNLVLIEPRRPFKTNITDFSETKQLIIDGEKDAKEMVDKIIV